MASHSPTLSSSSTPYQAEARAVQALVADEPHDLGRQPGEGAHIVDPGERLRLGHVAGGEGHEQDRVAGARHERERAAHARQVVGQVGDVAVLLGVAVDQPGVVVGRGDRRLDTAQAVLKRQAAGRRAPRSSSRA